MKRKNLVILSISILGVSAIALSVAGFVYVKEIRSDNLCTVKFDTNEKVVVPSITVKSGSKIQKPDVPEYIGYYVSDWLYGENPWNFEVQTVEKSITLKADWELQNYIIQYDLDGGSFDVSFPTTFNIESEFELIPPNKDSNIFLGWFKEDGNRIDSVTPGMYGDLNIKAKWTDKLKISSPDARKGNVYAFSDKYESNTITVSNRPVDNRYHLFTGWYDGDNNLVSKDNNYTFNLSGSNQFVLSSSYMNDSEEETWNKKHGVAPVIIDENTITYGFYPQSYINDSALEEELNSKAILTSNMFYSYRNDYYYHHIAKVPNWLSGKESLAKFDCGMSFQDGKDYWFKCDPIQWNILSIGDDALLIHSDVILDQQVFYSKPSNRENGGVTIYPNNYEFSSVRNWLNDVFIGSSFSFNRDNIIPTIVDNSAKTTASENNPYACNDTTDLIFLLSYQDYLNTDYGFLDSPSNSSTRLSLTTDFSRTKGVLYGEGFYGYYWTRSPYVIDSFRGTDASRINKNGVMNSDYVGNNYSGVRPAMYIKL